MPAPVDAVGGCQADGGPWPNDCNTIAEGDQIDREVELSDGTTAVRTVTITDVTQLIDGTDAYSVSYIYDDGGGA